MKKLRYFSAILLATALLLFAAACTRTAPLATPKGLNFDDSLNLYWTYVPGARSYTVSISGDNGFEDELTSHVTHVSLEYLSEGDYDIKIMAVGGANNEAVSAWSEPVEFRRIKDSGLVFESVNGNTEYAVSKVGSASGDVTIENEFRGKPVTAIAEDAFRGKGSSRITSVTIGENVKTIGNNAFYNCTNLTSIVIPDTVTSIGTNLFQGCSRLSEAVLPASIGEIPAYTFAYCRALESFTIGSEVLAIGESAFYNCSKLKSVEIPDSVVSIGQHAFDSDMEITSLSFGSGISYIGDYAFYNCNLIAEISFRGTEGFTLGEHVFESCSSLEEIELPEGLENVGAYDFYRCTALSEVSIPESVISVGAFAFRDTAIFNAQGELQSDGYIYTKEGCDGFIYVDDWIVAATDEYKLSVEEIRPADVTRKNAVGIADQTFVTSYIGNSGNVVTGGPPNLRSVTLPAGIRYLGVYAFYKCAALGTFLTEAGSELLSIGDRAFQGCDILRSVRLPEGLREIGSYAFYNCAAVNDSAVSGSNILAPSTVERIGTYAFFGTALWNNAPQADGIVYAGDWVVGFNELVDTSIKFKDGIVGVADFAFYQNAELQSITGLSSVRKIGRGAFFGCTALNLISLNPNLTEIADNTFSGCSSLFIANLPYNLKRIGNRAFFGCTLLDSIDLSVTDVVEIGTSAFSGCTNVKTIELGEKLERIGANAFYGLNRVTELVIPDSITEIGSNAFTNCSELVSVSFGSSLERIGAGAFHGCTALASVSLPDNIKSIGSYAFYKCSALSEVDLGSGLEEIGEYAFALTGLKSLVLPASVKTIGNYAFKNCKELTSVLLLGTPDRIGMHAFYSGATLTFFSAGAGKGNGWNARWNSSFRPVVWNCTLSEDGGYVESFTVSFEDIDNPFARGGFSAPARKGYDFVGWALSPGGEAVYGADDWRNAEFGTTLYSVWRESTGVEEPAEPTEPQPSDPSEGGEEQSTTSIKEITL